MISFAVQLHVPAGTWTMSPLDAEVTALPTAVREQFAAVIVAASTCQAILKRVRTARETMILTTATIIM
jgi:hypothetical protein